MFKARSSIIIFTILLISATYVFGYSNIFTVSSVQIVGTNKIKNVDIKVGDRLARLQTRVISTKLEALGWVASAQTSRNWISGKVVVEIVERTPIAIFKNRVIDENGKVFSTQDQLPKSLIQVEAKDEATASLAVIFLTGLPTDITKTISLVTVESTGALVFVSTTGKKKIEVRWGLNSENPLKIKVFRTLISLPENANIRRVDVSAPLAPIVK